MMFDTYIRDIARTYLTSQAREESYYPALKTLLETYAKSKGLAVEVIVSPKRGEAGLPDFVVRTKDAKISGYVEAKDVVVKSIGDEERSEQLTRYRKTIPNLLLTDFFSFALFRNGEKIATASLAEKNSLLLRGRAPRARGQDMLSNLFDSFFSYSFPPLTSAGRRPSAKRYVLYVLNEEGEPQPVKWSSHGLGQLIHEKESEWEKQLWTDILLYAYGKISKAELLRRYQDEYAIAKLVLTKPSLLQRVRRINRNRAMRRRIKPYNFVLVGSPSMTNRLGTPIVPITPFVRPYDLAPYQPFVDANSGRLYRHNAELYWKILDATIEEYVDHPESKFENGDKVGKMKRRHLTVSQIKYIGKESNELEDTEVLGVAEDSYVEYLGPAHNSQLTT